jgi:sigma-B regulation protein RsbU (phosphoserine phosphatase)
MPESDSQVMQCMEVWGGNQPVDSAVVMAGLDAWVFSKPFGNADGGGDVYYVSSCATGRITRILVADVAGHGASVRELATELRGLMRRHVNQLDQTRFVRLLNAQFTALSKNGIFATAVVTSFFATNNHLSLCNAGHPPPLLYTAASGQWAFLERARPDDPSTGGLPLGIEDVFDYTEFEVRLRKGDMVLCYTDSLVEARFPDGEFLGTQGLLRLMQTLDVSDPQTLIPSLLAAIIAKTGDSGLAADDITALLFRAKADRSRVSFFKRAVAPFRLMAKIVRNLRPGGEPIPWPDFSLANLGGTFVGSLGNRWSGRSAKR